MNTNASTSNNCPDKRRSNTEDKISSTGNTRDCSRVLVLSDSQGKNLYSHLKFLDGKYNVMVVTKSGATLKQVVKDSLPLIKNFTLNDHIILLASTNNVGELNPYQITVYQGLALLLSSKVKTNIINDVPYRHDSPFYNNDI